MNPFSRTIINGVLDRGRSLPSRYRLFYSRTPNNWLDVGWEGDFGWDSDLSSWSIPVSCYDAVSADTFWFSNSTTPVARTGAEIVAWAGTNNWNVLFSLTRGLAVYSLDAPLETINKARRYFNSSAVPLLAIYPTLAWGLKSSAGLTSLYGPNPTFVSAGATPDGIGGTYPANVLPVDKANNDVYVGPGYTNLLTPAPTAPYDLTLTAQKYCLQCFDSGSVSCSYGTATPGTPLIFTATAGTTTFTPTSCGEWMLTASRGYVYPRIAHGISVVSCAGSVGGNGLSWLMDAKMLEGLRVKTDGVELVANVADREFSSDTGWWEKTNATISAGKATTTGEGFIKKSSLLSVGSRYLVKFTISGYVSGDTGISSATTDFSGRFVNANGTFALEIKAVSTQLRLVGTVAGISFDNISVQKLIPSRCTVAALVRMGAGSAELPDSTTVTVLTSRDNTENAIYCSRVTSLSTNIARTNDGSSTNFVLGGWSANEYHLKIVQTNKLGTQFRVGNKRLTIDSVIQWSAWANYDGSFNPLTYLRAAYNGTVPMHIKSVQVWDRGEVPDATINDWGVNRL